MMTALAAVASLAVVAIGALPLLRWHSARSRWRQLSADGVPRRRRLGWVRRGWLRSGRNGDRNWLKLAGLATAAVGLAGFAAGGPVAGGLLAVYGAAGAWLAVRHQQRRAEEASLRAAVDAVAGLAARLRAGLAAGSALAEAQLALRPPTAFGAAAGVARRLEAAVAVAESSGAPLAGVLDQLDRHLRAAARSRAAAQAQSAGARASAGLLASLPLAGLGLGYAIGIDPFSVLFRTPLGAACLAGAVLLQLAGLLWSARLCRFEVPV